MNKTHAVMVEIENDHSRRWIGPFDSYESQSDGMEQAEAYGYWVIGTECAPDCWCER